MRAIVISFSVVTLGASLAAAQQAPTQAQPAPAARAAAKPKPRAPVPAPVLGPPVAVPAAPPPVPYIPPIDTAPPHPTEPPPPPPVHADAPGEASKIGDGLRLTFGAARADFNPRTDAALSLLANAGRANPDLVYNVYAHAPGAAEDLSASRRLSLERGLMVRSALINAGIASTRVYVHAMGAMGLTEDAPADRVDIIMATLDTARPLVAPIPPPAPSTGIPTPQ
jgi:outer membrane protein OmpA-like peptidoglycan-associated protein